MSQLRWRVSIPGEAHSVWDRLVDWERMHTWFVGLRRMTLLAAEPSVGAVRRMQLFYGTSHYERITRWEPPTRLSIAVLDPPFIGRNWVADIDLHEHPSGVELCWELRYEPRFGLAGRIVDRMVVRPGIDVTFRVSLRRLRAAVQAAQAGA